MSILHDSRLEVSQYLIRLQESLRLSFACASVLPCDDSVNKTGSHHPVSLVGCSYLYFWGGGARGGKRHTASRK